MAPNIGGALLTLELTYSMQLADKATWIESLRGMGIKTIRLQQLALHHKDPALLALK